MSASSGRFSALLLEGLDHYRKGRMMEAVRAWEEAYLLEPTNLRAREFLRSALERIHAHMGPGGGGAQPAAPAPKPVEQHPWLSPQSLQALHAGKDAAALQAAAPAPMPIPPAPRVEPVPLQRGPQDFRIPEPPPEPVKTPPPKPAVDPQAPTQAYQTRPSFLEEPTRSPRPGRAETPPPLGATRPPASSPWDDGPSLAIPQKEEQAYPGDETSGAWNIHREVLPLETVTDDETQVWMRGARELVGLNDFSGALELTGKVLARKPGDKEAQQMHDLCEHNLTLMYESKIGAMDARPRIAIPPDEIIWLNLDPRAGFVLAQIDGEVSFEDLYAICGLKRLDTARILCELLEQAVVSVAGQDRAVAKRAMHRQ